MASSATIVKGADVGTYGFIPDHTRLWGKEDTLYMSTTVFTMGGKSKAGTFIALLHLATWITAAVMIGVWGNGELDKLAGASDSAKMLGMVYCFFIIAILVMVLVHAALARKDEPFGSTIASVALLTMLAFENSLGCAYVAYSLVLGNSGFYSAAVVSQLFVCLGSGMIVAFYVNWSHRGDVEQLLGAAKIAPA